MNKSIVRISGVIVGSEYDDGWNTADIEKGIITPASRVVYGIGAAADDLEIRINSYGGDVFAGNAMSIALQQWSDTHPDNALTIVVESIALSAAACIIARAPRRANILAYPESLIMFHSCSTLAEGGPGVMKDAASLMDKLNNGIIHALLDKTMLKRETVVTWFDEGREGWLDGFEAQAVGLVNQVIIDKVSPEKPQMLDEEYRTPRMAAVAAVYTCQACSLAKHLTQKGKTTMPKAPHAEDDPEKKMPEPDTPCQEEPIPEEPEKKPDKDCPCQEEPEKKPDEGCPCQEEPEKKPDEDEVMQLKQQLATVKAALDEANAKLAKLTAGFRTGSIDASKLPASDIASMLRNIPADASIADQAKALNHIRDAHPQAYKAYMDAHQKRHIR